MAKVTGIVRAIIMYKLFICGAHAPYRDLPRIASTFSSYEVAEVCYVQCNGLKVSIIISIVGGRWERLGADENGHN